MLGLEILQNVLSPPGQIAELAQIGEGPFGSAHFVFLDAERVGEADEELAVAFSLVEGEDQNAAEIVALGGLLLLAEVAHEVEAVVVLLAHDEKQEGLHIVVEVLVVQEEFGQVAQVLAIGLVLLPVHFEHAHSAMSVNLVARGVHQHAARTVARQVEARRVKVQAELADVKDLQVVEAARVRAVVPCFAREASDLDRSYGLEASELLVHPQRVVVHTLVFVVLLEFLLLVRLLLLLQLIKLYYIQCLSFIYHINI